VTCGLGEVVERRLPEALVPALEASCSAAVRGRLTIFLGLPFGRCAGRRFG
jgi:hypothetical protein